MLHILFIEASPRRERSASLEVAQAFLDALMAETELTVDTLALWSTKLPEFDGDALEAKYAGLSGSPLSGAQQEVWLEIAALANRFRRSDLILLAVPLWNWSIPYRLKHLIDLVSHKDVLFTFDGTRFQGLLQNKTAVAIYARGLDYGPGSVLPAATYDFQRPYLELWLEMIGVRDVETILVEKTLVGPEIDLDSRHRARHEAAQLAHRLALRMAVAVEQKPTASG